MNVYVVVQNECQMRSKWVSYFRFLVYSQPRARRRLTVSRSVRGDAGEELSRMDPLGYLEPSPPGCPAVSLQKRAPHGGCRCFTCSCGHVACCPGIWAALCVLWPIKGESMEVCLVRGPVGSPEPPCGRLCPPAVLRERGQLSLPSSTRHGSGATSKPLDQPSSSWTPPCGPVKATRQMAPLSPAPEAGPQNHTVIK